MPYAHTSTGWNWIYYALGAFAVFSTGAAVHLSHTLLQEYRASVAVNQKWAERTTSYAEWGMVAFEGNAPGNDVFESLDVEGESAKLEAIVSHFDEQHAKLLEDLETIERSKAAALRPHIDAAATSFEAQAREAEALFAAFRRNDRVAAGMHMAAMDRQNAQTAVEIGLLVEEVQAIEEELFAAQLDSAARVQSWQYGLIALVALLVGFTVAYGRKLTALFKDAQDRIDRRNRDLRLVFDNVGEGLVTVALDGTVADESSTELVRLFGTAAPGAKVWDVVARTDEVVRATLELGFEALREGFMPVELTLSQLPQRVRIGEQMIAIAFRPILQGQELRAVLMVAQDITETSARAAREHRQAELLQLFNRVTHDRNGVMELAREAEQIVHTLVRGVDELALTVVRRLLHTLKGNASFYGLARLASVTHALEDRVEDTGAWTAVDVAELEQVWSDNACMIRHLLGDESSDLIEIEPEELAHALQIARHAHAPLVVSTLESWQHERVTPRLERIQQQVEGLASRLGKQVEVKCDIGIRRLESHGWEGFWSSLTHVLRNAIDHGIERPEERMAAGKAPVGRLTLRASAGAESFVLEVEDDGRGIDWDRLAQLAKSRGITVESEGELQHVLLREGISTADRVTDISGRGIGMSAMADAMARLGGVINVRSERGRGTCIRFELPLPSRAKPRACSSADTCPIAGVLCDARACSGASARTTSPSASGCAALR